MAPPLSLEGAISAPEGTLRVPEGMVCKLQQVLRCPLKGFTDLLRDPLDPRISRRPSQLEGPARAWGPSLAGWPFPWLNPGSATAMDIGQPPRRPDSNLIYSIAPAAVTQLRTNLSETNH